MKNIAVSLALAILLAACSSGSTVAPLPATINSQFAGTFTSQNGADAGSIRLDVVESDAGAISGNLIINSTGTGRCLRNGRVSGSNNGFNLNLMVTLAANRFRVTTTTTTTTTNPDGTAGTPMVSTTTRFSDTEVSPSSTTNGDTMIVVTVEPANLSGNANFQLAISNNGNTISGTYLVDGDICSSNTGTGEVTLNRI